jgi:hypothetical protein
MKSIKIGLNSPNGRAGAVNPQVSRFCPIKEDVASSDGVCVPSGQLALLFFRLL